MKMHPEQVTIKCCRFLLTTAMALAYQIAFAQPTRSESKQCCVDLATSPRARAQMGWNTFDVDERLPTHIFQDGAFKYLLIDLPERKPSKALKIELKIERSQGFPGFPNRTYFHPFVELLDTSFVATGVIPTGSIAERYEGFFGNNGFYVEPTFILPADSQARAMLLRTSGDYLTRQGIGREQCYSGAGGIKCFKAEYRAVATGSVSIRFTELPE